MTELDDSIRKLIEEQSVRPRLDAQADYMALSGPHPLPVAHTHHLYLWDDYRYEYLDWATTCHPAGHSHPEVISTVADHASRYGQVGTQGDFSLRWQVDYAKKLSEEFTPTNAEPCKVLYTEGEREAVWTALDMCRPSKTLILDTGVHDWLRNRADTHYVNGWNDTIVMADYGCLLASLTTETAQPVVAEALPLIRRARDSGVAVVIDESLTGFGRTGTMWGQEYTGLIADITVLGGPVGGGWSLGAVIASPARFQNLPTVSRQSGHPWACAAGASLVNVIHNGVLEYMGQSAKDFDAVLTELVRQFPDYLAGHHGVGLYRGLRFTATSLASRFNLDCRKHGLYVSPPVGVTVVLAPALITSTTEIARGADIIASVLMSWQDENCEPPPEPSQGV